MAIETMTVGHRQVTLEEGVITPVKFRSVVDYSPSPEEGADAAKANNQSLWLYFQHFHPTLTVKKRPGKQGGGIEWNRLVFQYTGEACLQVLDLDKFSNLVETPLVALPTPEQIAEFILSIENGKRVKTLGRVDNRAKTVDSKKTPVYQALTFDRCFEDYYNKILDEDGLKKALQSIYPDHRNKIARICNNLNRRYARKAGQAELWDVVNEREVVEFPGVFNYDDQVVAFSQVGTEYHFRYVDRSTTEKATYLRTMEMHSWLWRQVLSLEPSYFDYVQAAAEGTLNFKDLAHAEEWPELPRQSYEKGRLDSPVNRQEFIKVLEYLLSLIPDYVDPRYRVYSVRPKMERVLCYLPLYGEWYEGRIISSGPGGLEVRFEDGTCGHLSISDKLLSNE